MNRVLAISVAAILSLAATTVALAQEGRGGVLAECAALSPVLDDIHTCLDNYLDVMDDNLADITTFIQGTLSGEAKSAFATSQRAFAIYRRDNCLWYLAFSTPRSEAEQIAKDCLATMSIERLSELQRLIARDDASALRQGYYVYGANRNSFRPCGSDARYWVEGDAAIVNELQQRYLDTATTELQVLFTTLRGELDEQADSRSGHDGVLSMTTIDELRLPREADCRPSAGSLEAAADAETVDADNDDDDGSIEVAAQESAEREAEAEAAASVAAPSSDVEPDEELYAYFGAWQAHCTETGSLRVCRLTATLDSADGGRVTVGTIDGNAASSPTVTVARRSEQKTAIEVQFPGREIDSPNKIRWRVDSRDLGTIVGSSIRVDAEAARQLIADPGYVDQELLPKMIDGAELYVEVLASDEATSGERFSATLIGLTAALALANDFVSGNSGL